MPKLRITNLTNSPFDLDGGVRLPAMGRVVADFSPEYAAAIMVAPGVAAEEIGPLDHDGNGKAGGSLKQPKAYDIAALRAEYEAKIGKRPFMGWDAATLRKKLAEAK